MKLAVAVGIVCGISGVAFADRHEVAGASFEVPAGWEAQDAPDHSTLIYKVDNRFAIFVVYTPHPATGNLPAMFAADWKASTVNTPTATVPKSTTRKLAGRSVIEGVSEATSDGSQVTVSVLLLDAGGQIVPTLIYTQDRKMLKTFQADVDKIIASIKVAPPAAASAPPASAPDAPTAATLPPATGARKLTTVTLKDIAGSWSTNDQAVTGYVDASSGAYAGSQVTATSEWYDIKPDGSYARRFRGLANGHVFKESAAGKITMTSDAIVFTENGKEHAKMHFIEFTIDADGTAHWKLLAASYPLTSPNVGLYGEKWVRAVVKPK